MRAYKARSYFSPFHKRTQKNAVIVAHRRAGKSVACVAELLRRAINDKIEGARYAYVAPFYRQAKDIAWAYLLQMSAPWAVRTSISELSVTLHNGNIIRLYGADNADALRGLRFDGLIADEFGDWKAGAFQSVILPTLLDRNGWFVIIGTAKGHNDFYDIYKQAKADPTKWYVDNLAASKTQILNPELLAEAKALMSEDQYLREFENSFESSLPGSYYGDELRTCLNEGRICKVLPIANWPTCTAWDLGRTDSTVIWWFQQVANEIHILECYEDNGKSIDFYCNLVDSKSYKYEKHYLPHDARAKTIAANYSVAEQVAKAFGLRAITVLPQTHIQDGIQSVRAVLDRCWFDEQRCEKGLEALRQYHREWDEDKKCFKDHPLHDFSSHFADAFRYLSQAINLDKKPKEDNKDKPIETRHPTLDELFKEHDRKSRRTRI